MALGSFRLNFFKTALSMAAICGLTMLLGCAAPGPGTNGAAQPNTPVNNDKSDQNWDDPAILEPVWVPR
jgi:hypothetical protein